MWNYNRLFADIPADRGRKHAVVRCGLAEFDIGHLEAKTPEGRTLHISDIGGTVTAKLIVDSDGISLESGGRLYSPIFLLTSEVGPSQDPKQPEKEWVVDLNTFADSDIVVE